MGDITWHLRKKSWDVIKLNWLI